MTLAVVKRYITIVFFILLKRIEGENYGSIIRTSQVINSGRFTKRSYYDNGTNVRSNGEITIY